MHRVHFRGPNANSEVNLQRRENALALLFSYYFDHFHPVFVDETHWEVGWSWSRTRYRKGDKNIEERTSRRYAMSALSAITDFGSAYPLVVYGSSINSATFMDCMKKLLHQQKDHQIALFMDNASIHKQKDLKDVRLVLNAPYSPESNPIETFFAEWKRKVDSQFRIPPRPTDMVKIIEKQFMNFTPDRCHNRFTDLLKNGLPRVVNHEHL